MKYQQLIRIDRCYNDKFYLLEKKRYDNKFIFKISGSTLNIYSIIIDLDSKIIECDCPDSIDLCKKCDISCKHVCFVLLKVLKITNKIEIEQFLKNQVLHDQIIELIKYNFKLENDEQIINKHLVDKFNNIKDDTIVIKSEDDICPICYDNIEYPKNIIQCNCCKKIFHKPCIDKWFSIGKSNCPYCRSDNINCSRYKNLL